MNFKSRHSSSVGFYSLFAYLFKFAAENELGSAVCISGSTSEIKNNFEVLGFPINIFVEIDSINTLVYAQRIAQLEDLGVIQSTEREIETCSCGKVFIPRGIDLAKTRKTLVSGHLATCCGSTIISAVHNVLQTSPLNFPSKDRTALRTVYEREISRTKEKFSGRQVVISRSTKTPLAYIARNKRRYYIDSDFINYLSPVLFGDKVRYILGGRNLVKHTIFYDFYNRDISKQPLEFILLPKVLLDRNVSIKELVDTYGPDRVVARLVTAASSPRLKINLQVDSF